MNITVEVEYCSQCPHSKMQSIGRSDWYVCNHSKVGKKRIDAPKIPEWCPEKSK